MGCQASTRPLTILGSTELERKTSDAKQVRNVRNLRALSVLIRWSAVELFADSPLTLFCVVIEVVCYLFERFIGSLRPVLFECRSFVG